MNLYWVDLSLVCWHQSFAREQTRINVFFFFNFLFLFIVVCYYEEINCYFLFVNPHTHSYSFHVCSLFIQIAPFAIYAYFFKLYVVVAPSFFLNSLKKREKIYVTRKLKSLFSVALLYVFSLYDEKKLKERNWILKNINCMTKPFFLEFSLWNKQYFFSASWRKNFLSYIPSSY